MSENRETEGRKEIVRTERERKVRSEEGEREKEGRERSR